MKLSDYDQVLALDYSIYEAVKDYNLMNLKRKQGPCTDSVVLQHITEKMGMSRLGLNSIRLPNSNFPYHNGYHTNCMMLNCYEGAKHHRVSPGMTQALLVAAFFHDYNHCAGHAPDTINIKIAIDSMNWYFKTLERNDDHLEIMFQLQEKATALIEVTQYPYVNDPLTNSERIIRDADLMQAYEEDDRILLKQHLGLKAEMEILNRRTYTNKEFADGCKEFLDKVVWHTEWAKKKAEIHDWEGKKQRLYNLLVGNK